MKANSSALGRAHFEVRFMGRILVVGGQLSGREKLVAVLTAAGYEVVEAADVGGANVVLRSRPTDLVITDTVTPEVNEYGFARTVLWDPGDSERPRRLCAAKLGDAKIRVPAKSSRRLGSPAKPSSPHNPERNRTHLYGRAKAASFATASEQLRGEGPSDCDDADRAASLRLAHGEELLRAILDHSPLAIAIRI
jgi:CheY-like chemotaxis protein